MVVGFSCLLCLKMIGPESLILCLPSSLKKRSKLLFRFFGLLLFSSLPLLFLETLVWCLGKSEWVSKKI